jgi:hypothetical protein
LGHAPGCGDYRAKNLLGEEIKGKHALLADEIIIFQR